MSRLPTIKPQKLIKILLSVGFRKIRQHGSHVFLKHTDGRTTVVPLHKGKDISRGLLRAILNNVKITPKQFQTLV